MNKLSLIVLGICVLFLLSCEDGTKESAQLPVSSGDELLTDDADIVQMAVYPTTGEMESEGIERSFENSPPLIPHTIEGMFKITADENQCMMCHMPEKAGEKNAKPLPLTHFTDYRPVITEEGDLYIVQADENEVVASTTGGEINQAMFNCNLCHVPQAEVDPLVKNLFEADFRSASSKKGSNLSENIDEGVK